MTSVDEIQRESTFEFGSDYYPFRKAREMIRPDAKLVQLTIPLTAYKSPIRTPNDFKDDPRSLATSFMYKILLHVFFGVFLRHLGNGKTKLLNSANKFVYNALLMLELTRADGETIPVNLGDEDEDEEEDEEEEAKVKIGSLEWDVLIASGQVTALRWTIANHTTKKFGKLIEDMIKENSKRDKPIRRKKMQLYVRAERGEEVSSGMADSANFWAHWCITDMSMWQELLYKYLHGSSQIMSEELNNFDALINITLVNPEFAFHPVAGVKLAPIGTNSAAMEIKRYMAVKMIPNPGYSEEDENDEDGGEGPPRLIEEIEWSFPFPDHVWLIPPAKYGDPDKLLVGLAPFIKRDSNARERSERHHFVAGLPNPDFESDRSLCGREDANRVQGEINRKSSQSGMNQQLLAQVMTTMKFTSYSAIRAKFQPTDKERQRAIKRRRIQEGDHDRYMQGVALGVGEDPDEVLGPRREGNLNALADRFLVADQLGDFKDLQDPQGAARARIESKRHECPAPDLDVAQSVPAFVGNSIVNMAFGASCVNDSVQTDHEPTVTVLDDLRVTFERQQILVDKETDPKRRMQAMKSLNRERLSQMAVAWSQNSKLGRVHKKLVRIVDEMLEDQREITRREMQERDKSLKRLQSIDPEDSRPELKRWMRNLAISKLGERAEFAHLSEEDMQTIFAELEKEKPKPANLSREWTYNVTNLSTVGQFHLDHIMDLERAAKCQHAHKPTYQCRWNCLDASRHAFGLHNNTLFTGEGMTSKSWIELINSLMMPPPCFQFDTHITTMANCTSGESNDLVKFMEEIPPALLEIEGNMAPGQGGTDQNTKAGAIMKNQLTSCKNVTSEFARTPEGMRTTRQSVRQCIGVIVGAMNRFANRVGKAMMSRWIHVPMRQIGRDDRDLLDVIMHNKNDPMFLEMQSRWQMEVIHQVITNKFIQGDLMKEPTMFVAQVMLKNYFRQLELEGASSNIRGYEQLFNSIRNGTCAYAAHMAYHSVLSRIKDKDWLPHFHREILKYLWATEDMVIFMIGLYSDMFVNPVEDHLFKMLKECHARGGLKQAMQSDQPVKQTTQAGAQNFNNMPDLSKIPDLHYWALEYGDNNLLKDKLRELMGGKAHESYSEDDVTGQVEQLCKRQISVGGNAAAQIPVVAAPVIPVIPAAGNSLLAAVDGNRQKLPAPVAVPINAIYAPSPLLQAQFQVRKHIPCMKLRKTELLISKVWLESASMEKIRKAAAVFSYNHATPRDVLWGRNTDKVQCIQKLNDRKEPLTISHPAFFETVKITADTSRVLRYQNPGAMNAETMKYFKQRDKMDDKKKQKFGLDLQSRLDQTTSRFYTLDEELDLTGFRKHCENNDAILDINKNSTWDGFPRETKARCLKKQSEQGEFQQFAYPDSFVYQEDNTPMSLGELLPELIIPEGVIDKPTVVARGKPRLETKVVAAVVDSDSEENEDEDALDAKHSYDARKFPASLGSGLGLGDTAGLKRQTSLSGSDSSASSESESESDKEDPEEEEDDDDEEEATDEEEGEEAEGDHDYGVADTDGDSPMAILVS